MAAASAAKRANDVLGERRRAVEDRRLAADEKVTNRFLLKALEKASHRERPVDRAGARGAPSFGPDALSA